MSVLRRSCYESQKDTFYQYKILRKYKRTLASSNQTFLTLNKAVISRTKFTETLKNRSSLYQLIKTVFFITHVMPKQSEVEFKHLSYAVYCMALGTSKCCQKGQVCNSTQLILNEILRSTLARLAFCENLSADLAKNKYRLSVLSGLNLEKTYGRSFRSRDKEKCPYKAGFECIQWQAKSELNSFLSNITDKITFIGLGEVRRVILGN